VLIQAGENLHICVGQFIFELQGKVKKSAKMRRDSYFYWFYRVIQQRAELYGRFCSQAQILT